MPIAEPSVLILGSKVDLTCDFVVSKLEQQGVDYLRLNSEDLQDISFVFDPINRLVDGRTERTAFRIRNDTLRSVWFRRPVFLREYGIPQRAQEQFSRVQWATFVRSLMVFQDSHWVNHPVATYNAEHKSIQLAVAHAIGMEVPRTVVTNDPIAIAEFAGEQRVAIKGLDTVLVREGALETFGFTTFATRDELLVGDCSSAPLIVQEELRDKLDIRVTVVGKKVFSAAISEGKNGVVGDWRAQKQGLTFTNHALPSNVVALCRKLTEALGLTFGAIDLALQDGKYFFLEINPTGEWAWLVDAAGLPIDDAVAELLVCR